MLDQHLARTAAQTGPTLGLQSTGYPLVRFDEDNRRAGEFAGGSNWPNDRRRRWG